jgi:hypothetical protein
MTRHANPRSLTRIFSMAVGFGLRCIWAPLILTSLISPAYASPMYTYEVAIANFIGNNNPSVFGTSTLETITFSNGNSTSANQTYSYADIVGATVTSVGGTFSITGAEPETLTLAGNPFDTFATTNAQGTLQLIPPFSIGVITTDSVTISVNNGDESISLAAWWVTGTWQHSGAINGASAFGALTAVPEPTSTMLFVGGSALIAVGRLRRRKRAPPRNGVPS